MNPNEEIETKEISTISEFAVTCLVVYLRQKPDETPFFRLLHQLYELINKKLLSKSPDNEILKDFFATPYDKDIQASLRLYLKKNLISDNEFYLQVRETLVEIGQTAHPVKKNEAEDFSNKQDVISTALLTSGIGGALIGSVVPGIGTVAGAVIGATIGLISNNKDFIQTQMRKITEKLEDENKGESK